MVLQKKYNRSKNLTAGKCFIYLIFLVTISSLAAQSQEDSKDFLYDFLQGKYELIGKLSDSDSTYAGLMTFEASDTGFRVIRIINGKTSSGKATIESALGGEQTVLRLRFVLDLIEYETTYLIQSDLDNYPRLSGYLYRTDKTTLKPGIETCFFVPSQ